MYRFAADFGFPGKLCLYQPAVFGIKKEGASMYLRHPLSIQITDQIPPEVIPKKIRKIVPMTASPKRIQRQIQPKVML